MSPGASILAAERARPRRRPPGEAELRGRKAEARSALEAREDVDLSADIAPAGSLSPSDLIAIERVPRAFCEASSGTPADKQWSRLHALFAPGALVEAGRGGPSDPGVPFERCTAPSHRPPAPGHHRAPPDGLG